MYGKIYGLTFEQHMKCLSNLMKPQMRSMMMNGTTNGDFTAYNLQPLHFDERTLKMLRRHSTDEVFSKRMKFLLHTIQHCADNDEENDLRIDKEVGSEEEKNGNDNSDNDIDNSDTDNE